jgi:hypothetical protein
MSGVTGWLSSIGGAALDYGGQAVNWVGGAYDWLAPSYLGGAGGWMDGTNSILSGITTSSPRPGVTDFILPEGMEITSLGDFETYINATTPGLENAGLAFGGPTSSFWGDVAKEILGQGVGGGDQQGGLGDLLSDVGQGLSQAGQAYGSGGYSSVTPSFGWPGFRGAIQERPMVGLESQSRQNLQYLHDIMSRSDVSY